MNLETGKIYRITFENGYNISGELLDMKFFGENIHSLWIDIGMQPVYIYFKDIKEVSEVDDYEK